jgi:ribosomal protein S18 acetylase RimI-like enzyme
MNLRPARPEDEPFLRQLRGQVDADRLFMNQWGGQEADEVRREILDLQFRAQSAHHKLLKAQWETHENVIEMDGAPVGRFVVSGGRLELRLVEIAIVREWRGKGIGEFIIRNTMEECARSGRFLSLMVEKTNVRALKLYQTLGFSAAADMGHHVLLQWVPPGAKMETTYSFGQ